MALEKKSSTAFWEEHKVLNQNVDFGTENVGVYIFSKKYKF